MTQPRIITFTAFWISAKWCWASALPGEKSGAKIDFPAPSALKSDFVLSLISSREISLKSLSELAFGEWLFWRSSWIWANVLPFLDFKSFDARPLAFISDSPDDSVVGATWPFIALCVWFSDWFLCLLGNILGSFSWIVLGTADTELCLVEVWDLGVASIWIDSSAIAGLWLDTLCLEDPARPYFHSYLIS